MVAERVIGRFKYRRETDRPIERRKWLTEYIYDEIREQPVISAGAEPLGEYAGRRVGSSVIESDESDE